ncbi:unnamed protein product [Discula destructiva]
MSDPSRAEIDDTGTTEDLGPAASTPAKQSMSYACEACRVAKVKCQEGSTGGICRRCAITKRECITKAGPRTRRRRSKLHPAATRNTPPPSAPSKTFTIDVPITPGNNIDEDPSAAFELLRETHESIIDQLVPEDEEAGDQSSSLRTDPPSSVTASRTFSTPASLDGARSTHSFSSVQPQFNLDFATSLLVSFQEGMLPYFPVVMLPPQTDVPTMAKERPFVLLAILVAASAGRSLQGHNLYDEEFRKVLGLKVVSNGERSLELLVGLLIYCAWFPFHLRPKNKQALQYIRMASDIVRDLELDQVEDSIDFAETRLSTERLDAMRAYLATQLLCSGFTTAGPTWQKNDTLDFQNWTATCCDILAGTESATSDQTLAWLVRLQHLISATVLVKQRGGRKQYDAQHDLLLIKGMEAQFREFQDRMPPKISSQPVIRMASLVTEMVLYGSPLLKFPYEKVERRDKPSTMANADAGRLTSCVHLLRTWFDLILSLPISEYSHFTRLVWSHIVVSIVMGLRLSFPIPSGCPGWDHAAARRTLHFGGFLARFSAIGGSDSQSNLAPASSRKSTGTDVLSASKVVIDVVRRKYEKRLAAWEQVEAMQPPHPLLSSMDKGMFQCPMLDGSLDQYIQDWDGTLLDTTTFTASALGVLDTGMESEAGSRPGQQAWGSHYHDLWATMTMGWTQDEFPPMDFDGTL